MEGEKNRVLKCVTCEKEIPASDTALYEPLEFFDDVCFCKECLTLEREGRLPSESA